jgi:hypothetical protein
MSKRPEIKSLLSLDANPGDLNWFSFLSDINDPATNKSLFKTRLVCQQLTRLQLHKRFIVLHDKRTAEALTVMIQQHLRPPSIERKLSPEENQWKRSWQLQKIEARLFKIVRFTPAADKVLGNWRLTKHMMTYLSARDKMLWSMTTKDRYKWIQQRGLACVYYGFACDILTFWDATSRVTFQWCFPKYVQVVPDIDRWIRSVYR